MDILKMPSMSYLALIGTGMLLLVGYGVGLAIYRLYFHPLARFPGPFLPKITLWYEFYQDIICKGQMAFRIEEWHKKYGPIVRINPNELSLQDPDFYAELYNQNQKLDKYEWYYRMTGENGSGFGTLPYKLHQSRRKSVSRYFSTRAVEALEYVIQEKIDKLCSHMRELKDEPIDLGSGFRALTVDVVSEYCFSMSYGLLDQSGFARAYHTTIRSLVETSVLFRHFPIMQTILMKTPKWLIKMIDLNAYQAIAFIDKIGDEVKGVIKAKGEFAEKSDRPLPTIIHEIYNSPDLREEDKTAQRMSDEGVAIMGAGSETTGLILCWTTYELLKYPEKVARLKKELEAAIPDPDKPPKYVHLQKLPYLTAVITEGLRFGYGVPARLPRIAPPGLVFKSWKIPDGCPISMSGKHLHDNPEFFPEPRKFIPERWVDLPERRRLEQYLVPFSSGPRMCVGVNLAWAELYLTLANVIRRFDLEIYKSTDEDFEMKHEFFAPYPKEDSIGLWVKAK